MITGSRSIDLDADASDVYALLADASELPAWQSTVREVEVRETGPDGRPLTTRQVFDAQIKNVTVLLRYTYDAPRSLSWRAEKGSDVKALEGTFTVEPTGAGTCRVRYDIAVDPGRTLGLLARGPVVDQIRNRLLDGTLVELERRLEA